MPSNIAKPNASTAVTSAVKPSPVAKPKPATIPSSTPGGLGVKPVKNKVPVRFSVNNVDDHDRTRLARPSKPKYEPIVDHGRRHHDYDTTYTHAYSDYDPRYGTSMHYGMDQPISHAYGGHSGTVTADSGYQSAGSSALYTPCTICNTNPQYVDPDTGKVWPYCSNVCQAVANPQPQRALCTVCQINPQHVNPNTGTAYAYCSQECQTVEAASRQAQHPQPQQNTLSLPPELPSAWFMDLLATEPCCYPGCTLPAILFSEISAGDYCSHSHEYYVLKGCINCRQAERLVENPLCQACDHTLSRYAPMLVQVPSEHKIFREITERFTAQWLHPTACPKVHAVYRVIGSQQSWNMYGSYRNRLEYYGQFAIQGKHAGNECLLWHGTRRMCNLGDPGNTTLCANPSCALCSIISVSFDVSKCMVNTKWARYGAGIYTSSVSSKANDYSSNVCSSNYKVMLLNNVAVGKTYETYNNKPTLVCPPEGCDSVYGKAGGVLRYDEVVVYTNDAIRPSWLVLYA